jgi:putative transposase
VLIEAEKANYPIAWMCQILKVPRSSFYDWRNRAVLATAARRVELAVLVKAMFGEFRQTYGCRRLARELNARGHTCSVGLVADLMREQGLKAVQPRAYRVTTVHDEGDAYPRTCSTGTSPPTSRAPNSSVTSPTCGPARVGCT